MIRIDKGSVQETLIIPLYARKKCTDKFPQLYTDPAASEICSRLEYDFSLMAAREQLAGVDPRETNICMDLTDHRWMEQIDATAGAVFFAAGVFHYLSKEDVKDLILKMAEGFPGCRLVFDTVGKLGYKMMMKAVLKNHGMKDFGELFYTGNAEQELSAWSDRITVTSRGYMLGYYDMKTPGVRGIHRFLARAGDDLMKMQIVRVEMAGKPEK